MNFQITYIKTNGDKHITNCNLTFYSLVNILKTYIYVKIIDIILNVNKKNYKINQDFITDLNSKIKNHSLDLDFVSNLEFIEI